MKQGNRYLHYFSAAEYLLWGGSCAAILAAFLLFDTSSPLTLCASLIGVTSLIFNAKGNPFGQFLMIVFSLLYGFISFQFAYYGEMVTYLGMTMPMAALALVAWLKHPYNGNKAQVAVSARLTCKERALMWALTILVTVLFYFILQFFGTASLLTSTLSVTTSFIAVFLTYKRSAYYAIAYACNDIVLIVLWVRAAFVEISYLSVVVCFVAFLLHDLYGFISWRKMGKLQAQHAQA